MNSLLIRIAPFLFKPSVNHSQATIRLMALERLDFQLSSDQQTFLRWLEQEQDLALIEQLVPKFPNLDLLINAYNANKISALNSVETYLLEQLVQVENLNLALELPHSSPLNLALIHTAAEQSLRLQLVEQLQDEALLLEIAINNNQARVRHAAAAKILSQEHLESLVKQAPQDKNLLRLAKDKLQQLRLAQEEQAAALAHKQHLLEQLRHLVKGADNNLYASRCEYLKRQWQEISIPITEQTAQEVEQLFNQAADFIAKLAVEEAIAQAEQERQAAALAAEEARLAQEEKMHQELADLMRQAEEQQAKQKQQTLNQRPNLQQLQAGLDKLETYLTKGASRSATKLQQQLQEDAELLAPESKLALHWRQLNAQLAEMKSWHGFAAAPKRESLCAQMEALAADAAMLPQIKADKIQALQQEWRNLGAAAANKDLWRRFKQAADLAYAPCKEWFAAQSQVRQYNQEQKAVICMQLENLVASQEHKNLSIAAVDELLSQIYTEWHRFNPVNRTEGKRLAERFQQALQPLKDRQLDFKQQHALAKQELINQAAALLENTNLAAALETSKNLQKQWRELGQAPTRQEHKLWKEFRSLCDQLFSQRNALREQQNQERLANLTQAHNQLTELKTILSTGALQQAQSLFKQLPKAQNLPKKEQARWHAEIKLLQEQLDEAHRAAVQNKQAQELINNLNKLPATGQITDADAAERVLLELEFLFGKVCPPEKQALLLEIQVARMNSGKGAPDPASLTAEAQELIQQWQLLGGNQADAGYQRIQALIQ